MGSGIFGMKTVGFLVLFSAASLLLHPSFGAVHKVGDSAGWTIIGNVNYKQWAATMTFHVGDIILFSYNPKFHNVMQVTHEAYRSCNATSPIATHTTGNDSIAITGYGHHFFLCGVPGHCQAGQKVDINVLKAPLPALAPAPAPTVLPSPTPTPLASSPSDASSRFTSTGLFVKFALAVIFVIATLANNII